MLLESGEDSVLLQLVKILNVVFGKTIGIFAQKPNLKVKAKYAKGKA